MTPKLFIPLLFVFLFVAAACRPERSMSSSDALATAVELSTHPALTPTFVREIWELDTKTCVEINGYEVWEVGDQGDAVQNMLGTVQVEVDGERVHDLSFATLTNSLITVFDPDTGESQGTFSSGSSLCFESAHLSPGLHLASLRFASTQGRQFEYTWACNIGDS
jgi:hypothetical protein